MMEISYQKMKLKIEASGIADRNDQSMTQMQDVGHEILAWYMIQKSYFVPLLDWIREQDKLALQHDKLSLPHLNPWVAGYGNRIRKTGFPYPINENIETFDRTFDVLKVPIGILISIY